MLIGVWIMIFLFLGFPIGWEQVLALITGLVIIIVAYRMPPFIREAKASSIPFVEHKSETKPIQGKMPEGSVIPEGSIPEEKNNLETIINNDSHLTA